MIISVGQLWRRKVDICPFCMNTSLVNVVAVDDMLSMVSYECWNCANGSSVSKSAFLMRFDWTQAPDTFKQRETVRLVDKGSHFETEPI